MEAHRSAAVVTRVIVYSLQAIWQHGDRQGALLVIVAEAGMKLSYAVSMQQGYGCAGCIGAPASVLAMCQWMLTSTGMWAGWCGCQRCLGLLLS